MTKGQPMKTTRTIDEITTEVKIGCTDAMGGVHKVYIPLTEEAKAELLATILAGLPEKKKLVMDEKCAEHNKTNWEHTETYEVCSAHTQYNQAISEVEDYLDSLFGGKDE